MNTYELLKVLKKDPNTARYSSCKVLSRDQFLNLELTSPGLYIYNFDPISEPGSHWIAVHLNGNVAEHFDSFGLPPLLDITTKIQNMGYNIKRNTMQVQGNDSAVCGQYCLAFLMLRARNISWNSVFKLFSQCKDLDERDHIINLYITSKFHSILEHQPLTHNPIYNSGICQMSKKVSFYKQ